MVARCLRTSYVRQWGSQRHFQMIIGWMLSGYFNVFHNFQLLWDLIVSKFFNVPPKHLNPHQDEVAYMSLLYTSEGYENALPSIPPPQMTLWRCLLAGQICNLKLWLILLLTNHVGISNNSSFRQKHPGVPDVSDGSDRTSYLLTEKYTLPVAQATGQVAYVLPLLCAQNVVTYKYHQNDTCVRHFTGAAV